MNRVQKKESKAAAYKFLNEQNSILSIIFNWIKIIMTIENFCSISKVI
jgi:hypothetical protein